MADLARPRSRLGLARRGAPVDRGPVTEYLAFRLGEDVYAGPVSLIREILKPPPLTPVPRAPFAVMGIVSVRGQLVTVIDLRRRLRLPESSGSRRSRVLLVNPQGVEMLGLYVDEVLQVYRLAEDEIEHAAAALGGEVAPYISGIARPMMATGSAPGGFQSDPSLVILLELRSLLAT
jgi:purine-binding chemotaxis protein CheW